jgi:hypothetical protein
MKNVLPIVYIVTLDFPEGVLLKDIHGTTIFSKAIRAPEATQVFT